MVKRGGGNQRRKLPWTQYGDPTVWTGSQAQKDRPHGDMPRMPGQATVMTKTESNGYRRWVHQGASILHLGPAPRSGTCYRLLHSTVLAPVRSTDCPHVLGRKPARRPTRRPSVDGRSEAGAVVILDPRFLRSSLCVQEGVRAMVLCISDIRRLRRTPLCT